MTAKDPRKGAATPAKTAAAKTATPRRTVAVDDPRTLAANTPDHQAPGVEHDNSEKLVNVRRTSVIEDEEVQVLVTKGFIFTTDDTKQIHYKVGVQNMPLSHAEHWYSKANGVEIQ